MRDIVFRGKVWLSIRVGIGLGLFCYLLFAVDWSTAWTIVKSADVLLLIIMIILFFPGVYISCVKWKLLLRVQKIAAPMRKLFFVYLIGSFFQNFAPSTLGHDASRLYYMRGIAGKGVQNAASIITERATGVLSLVLWFFIAAFVNYDLVCNIGLFATILICLLVALILIVVGYFVWKSRILDAVIKRFHRINFLKKFLELVDKLIFSLSEYRNAPGALFTALLLSMCFNMLGFFSYFLLITALHLDVSFYELLFIMPIISLITNIPISINSWGIREGAFVLLFGQIGLSIDQAMAAALLGRALLVIASLSGAVVVFCIKKKWLSLDWEPQNH